jgi:hypothetical protein
VVTGEIARPDQPPGHGVAFNHIILRPTAMGWFDYHVIEVVKLTTKQPAALGLRARAPAAMALREWAVKFCANRWEREFGASSRR